MTPFQKPQKPESDDLPAYRAILQILRQKPDVDEAIRYIDELLKQPDASEPADRPPDHRASNAAWRSDSLITLMFESVLRGVSRDELVRMVLEQLDTKFQSAALCFFLLERVPPAQMGEQRAAHYCRVRDGRRLPSGLWRNFDTNILPKFGDSPFLKNLLEHGAATDFELSNIIALNGGNAYAGEFDVLAAAAGQRKRGYWITTVPLPSAREGHPTRAVVALYPNPGTELMPRPPAGAIQESRVLQLLGIAHRVLDHELANLANEIVGQRQRLLASLAPGILHHEIGTQVGLIRPLLNVQARIVDRLQKGKSEPEDPNTLARAIETVKSAATHLAMITSAFNKLERRRPKEQVTILDLVQQLEAICRHRLQNVGVELESDPTNLDIRITTDPTLLFHVFINIVTNAVNAFEDAVERKLTLAERRITIVCGTGADPERPIVIDFANSGPPIPDAIREKIFEKGYTTRKGGHGHGLFISRLIIHALGGTLQTLTPEHLPRNTTVCFRIELPYESSWEIDLAEEITTR